MILTDQLSPGQEGASVPVVPPASSGNTKRGGDVVTKPQSPATLHTTRAANGTSQFPRMAAPSTPCY